MVSTKIEGGEMTLSRMLASGVLAGIFGFGVACAQPENLPKPGGGEPIRAAVDAFMTPYVESGNFSGAVLITSESGVLADAAYGDSVPGYGVANTPRTRFQIGSISKTFTASSILILAQRGFLDLDDPVARFLPEFPNGEEITIHHLLSHTSGLPRFVFQPDYVDRSKRHHTASDLVAWVSELPTVAPPGERAAYSNANYAVLAAIVEQVSGMDYPAFLESEIFGVLGLDDTGLARGAGEIVPGLAAGFQPVGRTGFEKARFFDYTSAIGAGAVFSTTHDLNRWYRQLRSGVLLDQDHLRLLFSRDAAAETYAWRITEFAGHPAVSAQGWDGVGFSGKLLHLEDIDLMVVVLCNLNVSSITSEIVDNLASIALGTEAEMLQIVTTPGNPNDAESLAGIYRFGPDFYVPNATIEFVEDQGELTVNGFQPGALLRVGEGEFIHRQHWIRVVFEYDEASRATGIRYGNFRASRETAG